MKSYALDLATEELKCDEKDLYISSIKNDYFHNWQFWHIFCDDKMPPDVLEIATNDNTAQIITLEDGFGELTAYENISLENTTNAIKYVEFFLSLTYMFMEVISSVDEILEISEADRKKWNKYIRPPSARLKGKDYIVDMWLWNCVEDATLFKGNFIVNNVGAIQPDLKKVGENIGVSICSELDTR